MEDRADAEETLDPDDWEAVAALGRRMVGDTVAQCSRRRWSEWGREMARLTRG